METKLYRVKKPFGGYAEGAVIQLSDADAERHKEYLEPFKRDRKADAPGTK
ncbi:MAG: hypothetical protein WC421_07605 [Elusimicrobiales bacterium]